MAWVRSAPAQRRAGGGTGIVVVPGGPGLCSVLPYSSLRRRAGARGLDLVMMEHRGVGLSRRDTAGVDLRVEDVTVDAAADDLAAVLDAAGLDRAVIYGCSYGTYLAQVFGVRHPDRVAAMVLDSPILSAEHDVAVVREHRRSLLWHGPARSAQLFRELLAAGVVPADEAGHVVQVVYEFAGPDGLERLLSARLAGRGLRVWRWLADLGSKEMVGSGTPMVMEPDLVAGITFGELGYHAGADGLPLDPQAMFAAHSVGQPPFTGDRIDLAAQLPGFDWPTAVLSGDRDLRTPPPIAERVADLLPRSTLVRLPGLGHSVLDTHQLAALNVAHVLAAGGVQRLAELAPRIGALPRKGASGVLGRLLGPALTLDLAVPGGTAG